MRKQSQPEQGQARRSALRHTRDSGHLLLGILLLMAMMIIAAMYTAPRLVQQIKRDREEEMIHRGTEYARAIKKFYKKFGRYPTSIEQLENTNNIRFIRKRYKDPLTKKGEWKLLHYGDVASVLGQGGFGTPSAAMGTMGQQGFGAQQTFPNTPGGLGAAAMGSQFGGIGVGTTGGLGGAQPGALGSDQSQQPQPQPIQTTGGTGTGAPGDTTQSQTQGGSSFGNTFSLGSSSSNTGGTSGNTPGSAALQSGGNPLNQTFGAGAIVGVASLSKDPTIRIYNKKKKYDEWVFIYSPMLETRNNALLRGPYQQTSIGNTNIGTPAGQMNQQNQQGQQSPFGQQPGSGFGQSGIGNQGGFGNQGSFGNQQQQPVGSGQQFPPDQNQQQ